MTLRGYQLEALDPETGALRTVAVTKEDAKGTIGTFSFYELAGDPFSKDAAGSCVAEILVDPAYVFEGVRDLLQGSLCYSGIASRRWLNSGNSCPPVPGFVFTVYVNPLGYVYEWRWEKADERDPSKPKNYDSTERFSGGQIWPHTA